MLKRLLITLLSVTTLVGGAAACGDDEGEDQIGDDEIIDEGD